MPYFEYDGEIDVDVDEFLNACSSNDIKELIQALVEDGHLTKSALGGIIANNQSASESEFETALNKLHGKWNSLTSEEEEKIINIAKRF